MFKDKKNYNKVYYTNVSDDDISLTITNCQNEGFTDIKANISYDFSAGSSSSSSDETVDGGKLPEENASQNAGTGSSVENSAVVLKTDPSEKSAEQSSKADSKTQNDKTENDNSAENEQPQAKKTVAFFVAGFLFLAGLIVLGMIILKNRRVAPSDK